MGGSADGETRFRYKGTIPQVVLSAHTSVSLISKVFRGLFWAGLALYFTAAAVLLGLRYWILPNIDQWRPHIEAYATEALGAPVQIGQVQANWRGLNPSVQLTSLKVLGADGEPMLTLPTVSAVLGWRSVLVLAPRFLSLRVDDAELWVRRDAAQRLWVAGLSITLDEVKTVDEARGRSPLLRWLADQRDLAVVGATIHWQDELRQAPDLALHNVNLRFYNGLVYHRFALSAEPPAHLAQALTVRGSLRRNPLKPGHPDWTGELYAEVQDAEPQAWAPWVSVPAVAGRTAARAWLTWKAGEVTDLTADAALRDLRWEDHDSSPNAEIGGSMLGVTSATIHVQGAPGSITQWNDVPLARGDAASAMVVRAQLDGMQARLPELFDPALLQADEVRLEARVRHPAQQPLTVDVRQLDLVNTDLEAQLHGSWSSEGKTAAGTADFQGRLVRGSMSAIYRYLPTTVDAEARSWLAHGLPAGQVRDAAVTVRGDLDEFPFEDETDQGEFRIAGAYSDAIVDYAPADGDDKGWPRLEKLSGNFAVDKVSLSLDSPGGAIAHTGDGHVLTLGAVTATIPDMEHASTLHLEGEISGAVPAFLALATNYELGQLIDGVLDEAQGSGNWRVPLKLEVPLLNAEDTKVNGRIVFAANDFRFVPEMPMLRNVQGELLFSEQGVRTDEVTAMFLGGPARVTGKLEQAQDALRVAGTLPASGVAQWVGNPVMARLSGQTTYRGRIGTGPGGVLDIKVESDLSGLASELPAPFAKTRTSQLPLNVHWGAASVADSGKRDQLSVELGSSVAILMEHDRNARGSYFSRAALAIDRPVALPASPGLSVNAQLPALDLDAWQVVADEAGLSTGAAASDGRSAGATQNLVPALNQIDLQTQRLRVAGWDMDDLTFSAMRPQTGVWQARVQSTQAAGALSWQEKAGGIDGRVVARLTHLALGRESEVATSVPVDEGPTPDEDLSGIPAIDLQAERLLLYGYDVGRLEVVGTNLRRGQVWRLDKLSIANESATLDATGSWQLKGDQRGLTVDAKATFTDLGEFITRIGYDGRVSGGSGTIAGTLTWRDLPWTHSLSNIEGNFETSLDKGRFLTVDSRAARVLELLSLQSLQRLATFEANPAQAWRDGFPFDTIRGTTSLSRGIARTDGYKLNGPVAAIVLAGDADIVGEVWDMKAVVIPNLDASGAAVVTALAVNPLIGLGAFVTQWLLKHPLARAMTTEYSVTGAWDDPQVKAIETKAEPSRLRNDEHIEH